jgi:hypothetical protein
MVDMFLDEACTLMKYLPDRGRVVASFAVASARPSFFTFSGL